MCQIACFSYHTVLKIYPTGTQNSSFESSLREEKKFFVDKLKILTFKGSEYDFKIV